MNYILLGYLFPTTLSFVLLFAVIRLRKRIETISKILYKQEKRIEQLESKII